jgi:hypothetical protein
MDDALRSRMILHRIGIVVHGLPVLADGVPAADLPVCTPLSLAALGVSTGRGPEVAGAGKGARS